MRLVVLATLLSACSSDDELPCELEAIQNALDSAQSGQVVRLGPCAVEGSITVPDGVVFVGAGAEVTVFSSDPLAFGGIFLEAGRRHATGLVDVGVEGGGIGVAGGGEVRVRRVHVRHGRWGFVSGPTVLDLESAPIVHTFDLLIEDTSDAQLPAIQQLGGTAYHDRLRVVRSAGPAIELDSIPGSLTVTDSEIDSASGVGIRARHGGDIHVEATAIHDTRTRDPVPCPPGSFCESWPPARPYGGYGLDLGGAIPTFTFVDVEVRDNSVAPMRMDLTNGWPEGSSLENVTIDRDIVIENGTPPEGWDDGVTVVR